MNGKTNRLCATDDTNVVTATQRRFAVDGATRVMTYDQLGSHIGDVSTNVS